MQKKSKVLFTGILENVSNYSEENLTKVFNNTRPLFQGIGCRICSMKEDINYRLKEILHNAGFDLIFTREDSESIINRRIGNVEIGIFYIHAPNIEDVILREQEFQNKIKVARDGGAEKVLLYVLFEQGMGHLPSNDAKQMVNILANLDVDVIVATNGKSVQPYSEIMKPDGKKIPVFFSIGAFLTDSEVKRNRTSIIVTVDLGTSNPEVRYLPCYVSKRYNNVKNLILPVNNKRYPSGKTNQLLKEVRNVIKAIVGSKVGLSEDFNITDGRIITESYKYPGDYIKSGASPDDIFSGRLFLEKQSDIQKKILDAYRTTDEFKWAYGNYVIENNPYSEGVEYAMNLIRQFKNDEKPTLDKYRDLYIDMLYMRNVFGFYFVEYFRYDFENKNMGERMTFLQDRALPYYFDTLNRDREAFKILKNKYKAYLRLKEFYGRDIISVESQEDFEIFSSFVDKHNRFIVKPEAALQGKGIHVATLDDYKSKEDMYEELMKLKPIVCEELIVQDQSMAVFHEGSVNCIRVFTYCNGVDAKMIVAILKTGSGGSVVDNGAGGGLAAAIDIETGTVFTDGYNRHGENFLPVHPDSGITFKGFKIPKWEELKEFSCNAAKAMPTMPLIAWDIALSTDGWKIVEGNGHGAIFLYQTITKQGILNRFLEECEFDRYSNN